MGVEKLVRPGEPWGRSFHSVQIHHLADNYVFEALSRIQYLSCCFYLRDRASCILICMTLGIKPIYVSQVLQWQHCIPSPQDTALVTSLGNTCLSSGHMNQHHLYNVWKITSEAIDELHRSLKSCPGETAVAEDPAGLKVSQELQWESSTPESTVTPPAERCLSGFWVVPSFLLNSKNSNEPFFKS